MATPGEVKPAKDSSGLPKQTAISAPIESKRLSDDLANPPTHRPMYGESGYERRPADAYWTPPWCVDVLLRNYPGWLNSQCLPTWEPACGTGNIALALERNGLKTVASDLHDWGCHEGGVDFLKSTPPQRVSAIITNPPYDIAVEFVAHARSLMKPQEGLVAMLLRNEWDSAAGRTHMLTDLTLKLVLTRRPKWSEDDKASPRHNFAWFVWDFSAIGRPRIAWAQ